MLFFYIFFLIFTFFLFSYILIFWKNKNSLEKNINEYLIKLNDFLDSKVNNIENKFNNQYSILNSNISQMKLEMNKKFFDNFNEIKQNINTNIESKMIEPLRYLHNKMNSVELGIHEVVKMSESLDNVKNLMSSVKNRGIWGETQLEIILKNILSTEQFSKQFKIKENIVDFAIKLPFSDESHVWLPIDSKFPLSDFNQESYEKKMNKIEQYLKSEAKNIKCKYIYPPLTTDFAILFIPVNSVYFDILKNNNIFEFLSEKYNVIVVGPANMVATVNSIAMCFKTFMIQKNTLKIQAIFKKIQQDFVHFSNNIDKIKTKVKDTKSLLDNLTPMIEDTSECLLSMESLK